jgi:hypothetical protein
MGDYTAESRQTMSADSVAIHVPGHLIIWTKNKLGLNVNPMYVSEEASIQEA